MVKYNNKNTILCLKWKTGYQNKNKQTNKKPATTTATTTNENINKSNCLQQPQRWWPWWKLEKHPCINMLKLLSLKEKDCKEQQWCVYCCFCEWKCVTWWFWSHIFFFFIFWWDVLPDENVLREHTYKTVISYEYKLRVGWRKLW